jgi:hypothetical protein
VIEWLGDLLAGFQRFAFTFVYILVSQEYEFFMEVYSTDNASQSGQNVCFHLREGSHQLNTRSECAV